MRAGLVPDGRPGARVGGSSKPPWREAGRLSLGRCRRSSGLLTPAPRPHGPISTSGPQKPAPANTGPGTRHPRRGVLVGGARAGSDLNEGTWTSQSPAHRPGGPAHVSPRPRPPPPCHTPSCRWLLQPTRPPQPGAEPTAPLRRPAPPASPPLPRGRPENPERGSAAPPAQRPH